MVEPELDSGPGGSQRGGRVAEIGSSKKAGFKLLTETISVLSPS